MDVRGRMDLSMHAIASAGVVLRSPSTAVLYEHAIALGEARIAEGGPLAVDTGVHTGRSPKDKFVVREPGSEGRIWWGEVNAELSQEHFSGLRDKVTGRLSEAVTLYVID